MEWILSILISAVAFFLGAQLLSGVTITSFVQAIIVALVVAILNITLGTVLKIATLGLLAWGIFNWLLSALIIMVADYFLKGFKVRNFWWALGLAVIVALVSRVFDYFI